MAGREGCVTGTGSASERTHTEKSGAALAERRDAPCGTMRSPARPVVPIRHASARRARPALDMSLTNPSRGFRREAERGVGKRWEGQVGGMQAEVAKLVVDEEFGELQLALECQLCKEGFKAPVMLPCGHSFCSLCIRR